MLKESQEGLTINNNRISLTSGDAKVWVLNSHMLTSGKDDLMHELIMGRIIVHFSMERSSSNRKLIKRVGCHVSIQHNIVRANLAN